MAVLVNPANLTVQSNLLFFDHCFIPEVIRLNIQRFSLLPWVRVLVQILQRIVGQKFLLIFSVYLTLH
jgi:hypothetical protein